MASFTCGDTTKPEKAVQWALRQFGATNVHITEVTRGLEEGDKVFFHSIVTWEEELLKRAVNGQAQDRSRRRRAPAKPKA